MAHPKSRISKQRKRKRRTHYKITEKQLPQVSTCQTTGQPHLRHRAHWHEGKLYYRGRVFIDNTPELVDADTEPTIDDIEVED